MYEKISTKEYADNGFAPKEERKKLYESHDSLIGKLDAQEKLLFMLEEQLSSLMKPITYDRADCIAEEPGNSMETRSEWVIKLDSISEKLEINNDRIRKFMELLEI